LASSVVRLNPSLAAAPRGPPTIQPACSSVSEINVRSEFSAFRNKPDETFEWLDRAYANHQEKVPTRKWILFKNLRGDPRYAAFLKKLNLPTLHNASHKASFGRMGL
jgi:hypothetical protein